MGVLGPEDIWLSPEQVADRYGITRSTMYNWIHTKPMRWRKIGGTTWRIRLDDLRRYEESLFVDVGGDVAPAAATPDEIEIQAKETPSPSSE